MGVVDGVFGVVAATLVLGVLHYQWIILRHFQENEDASMTGFFVDKEATRAFNVVAVSTFVYAMTLFVSVAAAQFEVRPLVTISQLGTIVVLSGFIYFFYHIAAVTGDNSA